MKDKRIEGILNQILKFIASDYEERGKVSTKGDEIDAIIAGLNSLGEELHAQTEIQRGDDERKKALIEILLKFTVLDFSESAPVSEKGDELDAIGAGLNAMADEINHYREQHEKKASQLQATNKELESFTYSVSHDLRAPLRAVHGYSQILLEDYYSELDKEGQRILAQIMQNAKKMGTLIDNLLSYTRIGKTDLQKTLVPLNELVVSVIKEFEQVHHHDAEIIVLPMGEVKADYMMLSLVFQNLISNAIKYSSKEEKPIIEIGHTDTKKGKAFFVKDNGAGFDMAYYDKLFGVFQRLHRDEDFEGTGVGLAIVQRIILRHSGEIWAKSEPGKGTEFYFTIG
ncbi:MAG: ATP-binding protein [Balneolaceae bacterium]